MPNEITQNNMPPGIGSDSGFSDGSGSYDNPITMDEVSISSEPSWYDRSKSWLNPLLGIGAGVATGGVAWLPALIGGLFGIGTTMLQNHYNEKNYERQLKDTKDAEARANAEYDRRQADARAYNDAWDQRLLEKGYNPLALLNKGQGATSTSASSPSMPTLPGRIPQQTSLGNISQAVSIAHQLAQIQQTSATTKNIESDTQRRNQELSTFWEKFSLEMQNLTSTIENRESETRINTLTAQFKEATFSYDFQRAAYSTQQAYYEMERSGVSVEQAKADLSFRLNAVAQQAIQSQLMEQQLDLNNVTLDQLVTTWNANKHLVDEQAQAQLSLLNERVRSATKANNWYAVNQVVGSISSIGSTVSSLVNAFKPFPQITSTYTERSTIGEFGNVLGSTTEFRQNTYSK